MLEDEVNWALFSKKRIFDRIIRFNQDSGIKIYQQEWIQKKTASFNFVQKQNQEFFLAAF